MQGRAVPSPFGAQGKISKRLTAPSADLAYMAPKKGTEKNYQKSAMIIKLIDQTTEAFYSHEYIQVEETVYNTIHIHIVSKISNVRVINITF